jgi:sec-independent protein translocase protein TatC
VSDAADTMASEGRMTLIEHLTELRSRIFKCLLAVAVGMTVAWFAYDAIFQFLVNPLCDTLDTEECRLIITDPLEGLATRLRVCAYAWIGLAMPVLLWQVWRFVTPGLYPKERRWAVPFVISALTLFILGAGLAYWTLPKALDFLIAIGGEDLEPFFTPQNYIRLITYMMLAFGIGFEFPILLVFLQLAGILPTDKLRAWRRYAAVAIVVIVAVITPSGDPISLAALSIPMYLFYEISIVIGRISARRRARAAAEQS